MATSQFVFKAVPMKTKRDYSSFVKKECYTRKLVNSNTFDLKKSVEFPKEKVRKMYIVAASVKIF